MQLGIGIATSEPHHSHGRPSSCSLQWDTQLDVEVQVQQEEQSWLLPAAPSFLYQPSDGVSLREAHSSLPEISKNIFTLMSTQLESYTVHF